MSKKNKKKDYDYLEHSCATTEQTGLIPSGNTSDAERESYENLYPYPPPVVKKEDDHAH